MQKIVIRLRELLKSGQELKAERIAASSWSSSDSPDSPNRTYHRRVQTWVLDCRNLLNFAGLTQYAVYFADKVWGSTGQRVGVDDERLAALESAISQIEGGFVGNIRHLLHADIFDSVIEQAEELLTTGHRIPAAVLGRIVIEGWLRNKAEAAGISEHDTAKASRLNDELKTANTHSVAQWRQIQAHLDVGNAAAHGKTDEFDDDAVRRMLEYARANCL